MAKSPGDVFGNSRIGPAIGPAVAESINERIADEIRGHVIDFDRFAAGLSNRVLKILFRLELELFRLIRAIDPTGPRRQTYRALRLAKLLQQAQEAIREHYRDIVRETEDDLREIAAIASAVTLAAINGVVGAEILTVVPPADTVRALPGQALITNSSGREGAPSKDWWAKMAGDVVFRFAGAIKEGYVQRTGAGAQGETADQLVSRVKGTRARDYNDGLMAGIRRNAATLVHTSVQAVSNAARRQVFEANSDVIHGKVQISTLDNRTTPICMAYSGKAFDLNDKPIGHSLPYNGGTPRHFRCRSVEVPLLKDVDEISEGKLKNIPESTQASMDGQVPADLDYESWLRRKSVSFQKKMLGPGKWELWSQGKIGFTDLVDQRSNVLTLAELREKYDK